MEVDNAFAKVFQAFMAIPNAKSQFSLDKPIPPGVLLKYPSVAKVIFSNEPGCAVNYRAIVEKIKVLEPHFKVTSCGPALMEYFAVLRKKRNKWAVAFANYQSHMIMTFLVEQKLYGRPLNASQRAAFPDGPRVVLSESLAAAWQELSDIKKSREFVQNVRILEECIKQHKVYLQRKAAAEKQRQALVKMKQAEARKAKKAALASSAMSQRQRPSVVQSTFNPDLPDFAQFMSSFASPTPPAVAASSKKKPQQVTTNISQATKTAKSANATVGNKSAKRNGTSAAAAEAQPKTMAATSTNMTTQAPANAMAQTSLGVIDPTSAESAAQNMIMMGPPPAVRIDKPTSSKITQITRDAGTTEEWMMEEPLFPYFVSIYGYPPPNCFVGPLPGSHGIHKVYIEHQPKYTPEELEEYKQMGTNPPPARYVTLHEKEVTHQTPVTSQMPNTTNSNGMINMNDATESTVAAINHDGSDKEVEPAGLGHASSASNAASTPEEVTEQSSTEPGMNNEADVELEKALRAELGPANPDSAASPNNLPSKVPGSIEQAQPTVEQNTSTALEVSQDVPSNESGASLSACPPASNSPTLTSSNSTEGTPAEAGPSEFMSFEEFTERFNNGEFQDELPAYDASLDLTLDPTFDPTLNPTIDPTFNSGLEPSLNRTLNPTIDPTFNSALEPTLNRTLSPIFEPCNQSQDLSMNLGWQGWDGETALPPLGSTPDVAGFEENQYFNELFGRAGSDD